MLELTEAIERIKDIECPTGSLENRVLDILQNYKIIENADIKVNRNESFDEDNAQAYSIELQNKEKDTMIILASSGTDDYVAKVVDVYLD
jgi:hypothetical protein